MPSSIAFPPKPCRNEQWINIASLPPGAFVTCCMVFSVVDGAERHCELIADFEGNAS
jgi:hypothetical protein